MTGIDTVAIVGLGLIGGSLARDLASLGIRVLAFDVDDGVLAQAIAEGVVHAALGPELHGAEAAQVVVVAVPVQAAVAILERIARLPHGHARLVTDVGSTKRSVMQAAARVGLGSRFVGAHPLAGDHRPGWAASRSGSFADATVYLCAGQAAGEAARELARELWRGVGARPQEIDATVHDQRLALSSHLPQTVSSALARVLHGAEVGPAELGPGGRQMTRLAASPAELWTGIALDNADELAAAVDRMIDELQAVRRELGARRADALRTWFAAGAQWSKADPSGTGQGVGAKPASV